MCRVLRPGGAWLYCSATSAWGEGLESGVRCLMRGEEEEGGSLGRHDLVNK
jgi:hypothetical protein